MARQRTYVPDDNRYTTMPYRRCGRWGLKLPAISLGCWHNFGDEAHDRYSKRMICCAFDLGITHFDLANNYGHPEGSAETFLGKILPELPRDELIISTKTGFYSWPGPYGEHGSRKSILASLDRSLKRLGLDYVDIYYHHRPDPDTPLEETMAALDHAVRSGKALYVGISNYPDELARRAVGVCTDNKLAPLLMHQQQYHMFYRQAEKDLFPTAQELGFGVAAYCPLAQGLLTNKYFQRIPLHSRAASPTGFLRSEDVTPQMVEKAVTLNTLAQKRGQTLAQMALAWVVRHPQITTAIIGASHPDQITENVAALKNTKFSDEELTWIDRTLTGLDVTRN